LASDGPPKYERQPVATSFSPFEARVSAILAEYPEMPATVLAERVGWQGSITWFRDNVRRLRPEHRRPDPADRLTWAPGDAAQCDLWFPPTKIPLEDGTRVSPPVLVMVAAHSRFVTAVMIPTRKSEDLLLGSWELIRQLGRVPRRLIWDNEAGIGQRGRLAQGVAAFAGTLATRVVQLRPYDPESKGIVERRNGCLSVEGDDVVAGRHLSADELRPQGQASGRIGLGPCPWPCSACPATGSRAPATGSPPTCRTPPAWTRC